MLNQNVTVVTQEKVAQTQKNAIPRKVVLVTFPGIVFYLSLEEHLKNTRKTWVKLAKNQKK